MIFLSSAAPWAAFPGVDMEKLMDSSGWQWKEEPLSDVEEELDKDPEGNPYCCMCEVSYDEGHRASKRHQRELGIAKWHGLLKRLPWVQFVPPDGAKCIICDRDAQWTHLTSANHRKAFQYRVQEGSMWHEREQRFIRACYPENAEQKTTDKDEGKQQKKPRAKNKVAAAVSQPHTKETDKKNTEDTLTATEADTDPCATEGRKGSVLFYVRGQKWVPQPPPPPVRKDTGSSSSRQATIGGIIPPPPPPTRAKVLPPPPPPPSLPPSGVKAADKRSKTKKKTTINNHGSSGSASLKTMTEHMKEKNKKSTGGANTTTKKKKISFKFGR